MGIAHARFGATIVHFSVVDAVFRDEAGAPVPMSFHPFCGPAFEDAQGGSVYPDEDDPLWDQFNGWWEAKGRRIYRQEPSADAVFINLEIER
jgi:hypothetical protein